MTGLFLHDIEGYDSRDLEDDNDDDSSADGESLIEFPAPGLTTPPGDENRSSLTKGRESSRSTRPKRGQHQHDSVAHLRDVKKRNAKISRDIVEEAFDGLAALQALHDQEPSGPTQVVHQVVPAFFSDF